jgi:hypothetical protein
LANRSVLLKMTLCCCGVSLSSILLLANTRLTVFC